MRAFVALPLPKALLGEVVALQSGIAAGRVVAEENLHLTLAFLGNVDGARLRAVAEELSFVTAPPVDLCLRGLDIRGGRAPNLMWIGAEATEALVALQARVARAVRAAGVTLERRRFRPHVTLARFSKALSPKDKREIGEFLVLNGAVALSPAKAEVLGLFASHLRPDGAWYEPLAEVPLLG